MIRRGRALIAVGDIAGARLALKWAAEAGNATATLELGATYDPAFQPKVTQPQMTASQVKATPVMTDVIDVTMARLWYEKARDLGSAEAAARLARLGTLPTPRR
jgi:TPR repeat protein